METKKTLKNPHGLTAKQKLAVDDMLSKVSQGKPLTPVETTKKIYNVGSDNSARVITHRNLHDEDFREALIEGLNRREILGENGKVEQRLGEGLDAEDAKGNTDFKVRLEYIKEINKIAGVYAPEKHESKHLKLNLNMTKEELDERIAALKDELEDPQ